MIDIYLGDAKEISKRYILNKSVDLIFTDPPFHIKELHNYEWLAVEAARVLKPTGFLITYAGPIWKHQVMEVLGKHLEYFFDFILLHRGNTSIFWPRRIITGYKSLLCYHLKDCKPLPITNVLGKYIGSGSDKRFHKWGQEVNTPRYYIDVFSREGDLVVDYFLGAGTFGEVSKALNRNFVGFEIDEETYNLARARLDGALGPKEGGRQYTFNFK